MKRSQLNLFMYRVTPYTSLRKSSGNVSGKVAISQEQRMRLDLHYLLTAYGSQDFHGEILLGCAVQLLSGMPILTSDTIRKALQPATSKNGKELNSPVRTALSKSGLTDQLEQIKITQQFLSFEDMSKLWSMFQARYRPSLTYEVSAVTMAIEGGIQ